MSIERSENVDTESNEFIHFYLTHIRFDFAVSSLAIVVRSQNAPLAVLSRQQQYRMESFEAI